MSTITVTSLADDGSGGTTLREAIDAASNGATIAFTYSIGVQFIYLANVLTISKSVNIDASNLGSSLVIIGQVAVTSATAKVTMSYLTLTDTSGSGIIGGNAASGVDGDPGTDGTNGAVGTSAAGNNGTAGGNGHDGTTSSGIGGSAGATLTNKGTLLLDHVTVHGAATAGAGADGGDGGSAGAGGDGGDGLSGASSGAAGHGGNGGNGGAGGNGTIGGDAVGAISNQGKLTLKDSVISGSSGVGGSGGGGGAGGDGKDAGDGGIGGFASGGSHANGGHGGNGGLGGNGGNGGSGANGGSAVGGVLNQGTLIILGASAFFNNHADAGDKGLGGDGGEAGDRGDLGAGGLGDPTSGADGTNGSDGTAGGNGTDAHDGTSDDDVRGSVGGPGTLVHSHFYDIDTRYLANTQQPVAAINDTVTGKTLTYKVSMWGDAALAGSVHWAVVPTTSIKIKDFVGPTSGTLNFTGGDTEELINIVLKANASRPRDGSFTIVLDTPAIGDALGTTHSVIQHTVDALVPLVGNAKNNTLHGSILDDTIKGLAGNDKLYGDGGNDVLIGGAGADRLDGGPGNIYDLDTASYAGAAAGVTADLAHHGNNTGDAKGDTYCNIQRLTGSSHDDKLTADKHDNTIDGGAGDDTMIGAKGNDRYYVDSAHDKIVEKFNGGTDRVDATSNYKLSANIETLVMTATSATAVHGTGNGSANIIIGNALANVLGGGGDADTLLGSSGADTLNGGAGADVFIYSFTADSNATTMDVIKGWDSSDTIRLNGFDADPTNGGTQHFVLDGLQSAGVNPAAGHLEWYVTGGNTFIRGAVDGDHSHDLLIEIHGAPSLSSLNFQLV